MSRLRNFWIDATIDGRKNNLSGGPASRDGGIYLDLWMRDKGSRLKVANIVGWTGQHEETLYLHINVLEADGSIRTIEIGTPR